MLQTILLPLHRREGQNLYQRRHAHEWRIFVHHFKAHGGNMDTTNSVTFMFQHQGVFRLDPNDVRADVDLNTLELECDRSPDSSR